MTWAKASEMEIAGPGVDLILEHQRPDRDADEVAGHHREVRRRYDARAGHEEDPTRKVEFLAEAGDQRLEGPLHLGRPCVTREDRTAGADHLGLDEQVTEGLHLGEHEAGTERTRSLVDLGLRQVER